jgi:hypothetical protein
VSLEKEQIQALFLWDTPVYLRIGRGSLETVEGPYEALVYLSTRWPAERGPCYDRAKATCSEAVEAYGSMTEAREAFIAAAIEVLILA